MNEKVRVEEGLELIKGAAMLWPDAARLKNISNECKRKTKKGSTIIFTIGVEEIGNACALVLLKADFLLSVPQQNQGANAASS